MQSNLLASRCEVSLKLGIAKHGSKDKIGEVLTGLDIAEIVNSADEPVVGVVISAFEDLYTFFGYRLRESKGKKIAGEGVATRVRVGLLAQLTYRVEGGIELEGPRSAER